MGARAMVTAPESSESSFWSFSNGQGSKFIGYKTWAGQESPTTRRAGGCLQQQRAGLVAQSSHPFMVPLIHCVPSSLPTSYPPISAEIPLQWAAHALAAGDSDRVHPMVLQSHHPGAPAAPSGKCG